MEQLQKKRSKYLQEIRRSSIELKMKSVRSSMIDSDYFEGIKRFLRYQAIKDGSTVVQRMLSQLRNCHENRKEQLAAIIGESLYVNSVVVTEQNYNDDSARLILEVYQLVPYEFKMLFWKAELLKCLWIQLLAQNQGHGKDSIQLFQVAFQMSIFTLKQSKIQLEIEQQIIQHIIQKVAQDKSQANLRILTILLLNVDKTSIRKKFRNFLTQIGRRIFRDIINQPYSALHLNLLYCIGYHAPFSQQNKHIAIWLINQANPLNFCLAIKFLSEQTKEDFMAYKDLSYFLYHQCSQMEKNYELKYFLITICHILENETYDENITGKIYAFFFSSRLHHYITNETVVELLHVICCFLKIKDNRYEDDLLDCSLTCFKIEKGRMERLPKWYIFMKLYIRYNTTECFDQYISEEEMNQFHTYYAYSNDQLQTSQQQ